MTSQTESTRPEHRARRRRGRALMLVGLALLLTCPSSVAQAAPGDLDPTFAGDGVQITPFGQGAGRGVPQSVARQPDGKILAVGSLNFGGVLVRYGPDGSLDTTFSGDGIVSTDLLSPTVALQGDGRIVVAGGASASGTSGGLFVVERYNADGSLDTSFSGDGRQSTSFDGDSMESYPGATGVVVQSDDKIVAAGSANSDFGIVRYNVDGSPDTTFSSDGKLTTDFGGNDTLSAVVLQGDGKIVAAGSAGSSTVPEDFALARYNEDGSLDTTFSTDGKQTTDFSAGFTDRVRAAAVQPDGKVVVAGTGGTAGFALARYGLDGSLDTTFSTDGKQTTDFGGGFTDAVNAISVQSDGKVVAAGVTGNQFALARYSGDGTLDTTFSDDGRQITDVGSTTFGGGSEGVRALVVQPDGKITAAGTRDLEFGLARYNTNGSLDTTFSGDGLQTTSFPGDDSAKAVAIQPDGKIIAVGDGIARYNTDGSLDTTFSGDGKVESGGVGVALQSDGKIVVARQDHGLVVARYSSAGSLDTSFSGDGLAVAGSSFAEATSVAVSATGKIIVAGQETSFPPGGGNANNDFAVARLNPDGTPDTAFSGDGFTTSDVGRSDRITSVALQPDGKLVAAGTSGPFFDDPGDRDFALARYMPDGSLDTTFSGDGMQITDFGVDDSATAVALQSDNKIVAAGSSAGDVALARYMPDGSLDASFSGDGTQTTDFGSGGGASVDGARGVALQPDGKIIAVGAGAGSGAFEPDIAIARFDANGSLDTTFSGDGKQTTDVAGGADLAGAVAIQADGKIVIVGGGTQETLDWLVARYEGGGTASPPSDTTPPAISVTTPAEGQHFTQGQAVASAFTCVDNPGGSGMQACNGPATVDTTTTGARQFTVAGSDHAGNAASRTVNYVVDSPAPVLPRPGPPPGGNPGPVDTSAPTAKLSGTTSQKLAKTISVTIACTSEACSARASGSVRVPKFGHAKARSYAVKAVTRTIAKGKKITMKLTLTAATRTAITRALRAHKRVSVAVKIVVTDAAGNTRTLTRQIKLKR